MGKLGITAGNMESEIARIEDKLQQEKEATGRAEPSYNGIFSHISADVDSLTRKYFQPGPIQTFQEKFQNEPASSASKTVTGSIARLKDIERAPSKTHMVAASPPQTVTKTVKREETTTIWKSDTEATDAYGTTSAAETTDTEHDWGLYNASASVTTDDDDSRPNDNLRSQVASTVARQESVPARPVIAAQVQNRIASPRTLLEQAPPSAANNGFAPSSSLKQLVQDVHEFRTREVKERKGGPADTQ